MSAKIWVRTLSIIALAMATVSMGGTIMTDSALKFTESGLFLATVVLVIMAFSNSKK